MEKITENLEAMEIGAPTTSDSNFDQRQHEEALRLQSMALANKKDENKNSIDFKITNIEDFEGNYAKFQNMHRND
ncbi:Protein CBG27578 [Caenorhabditis briggsae]|uniref:Protein CBG27578 n=1 Tax=Caenorhabditis briggsae TaxID=6238 RepID=B6IFS2_CAEBR|nr:Protein CBG27578 [Caenorhabditis briggsae]CAR98752.1 Protein CBG27578 [Caenorhabditis briggsae]